MRHRVKGNHLSRNMGARKALLRSLVRAVLINQRITTRPALAKEARRLVEKLITLGKKGTLSARRRANRVLNDRRLVKILFDEIAPKFAERNGGYTRIYKLPVVRKGDGASLCLLELTEYYKPLKSTVEVSSTAGDETKDEVQRKNVLPSLRDVLRKYRKKENN